MLPVRVASPLMTPCASQKGTAISMERSASDTHGFWSRKKRCAPEAGNTA